MSTYSREFGANPTGFLAGIGERYSRYRVYRTTCAELDQLSDRELRDLGISKASIRSIAYKAAYGG